MLGFPFPKLLGPSQQQQAVAAAERAVMLPSAPALLRDIALLLGPQPCHHVQSLPRAPAWAGMHKQRSCCAQVFAARSVRCNNYECKLLLFSFFILL